MSISQKLDAFLNVMHKYQKERSIKNMCVTNTQYFIDFIRANFPLIQPIAKAFVCVNRKDDFCQLIVHVSVVINGKIYDPSYETGKIKNLCYYSTIDELLKNNTDITEKIKRELLVGFLDLFKTVEKINSDYFTITDKNYYLDQALYVEKTLKLAVKNSL